MDKRFSNVISNPRFKNIPRKDRKVQIDKRFQSMFTDKRFQVKYTVDERGRKINELQSDNYKKYYDLTDSSEESDSDSDKEHQVSETDEKFSDDEISSTSSQSDGPDGKSSSKTSENLSGCDTIKKDVDESLKLKGEEGKDLKTVENNDIVKKNEIDEEDPESNERKQKVKEAHKEINKYVDELHKGKINEKVRGKLTDISVDYARGIGTLLSDSESSSDEPSSDESDTEVIEHPWGELDKDAETTDEISRRLAVCNMDWDRVTAKDLMVLFHSFLPPGGIIESVTIYPSEFGLQRMAEEELKGPKELVECKGATFEVASDEDIEEGSAYQREKLREYQLKRLKYYYAIIVCNNEETANALYTECDGLEYESSATKLDLRFVPDEVTFDHKPHDVCTTLPDLKKYKPRLFINSALQQGKVDLTWDETDPNRIDFTRKVLAGEDVDENEVQAFLASSSSEEEDAAISDATPDDGKEEDDDAKTDQERILKYRSLIADLQDANDTKKGNVEMEVSWGADAASKADSDTEQNGVKCAIVSDSDKESGVLSDEDVKKPFEKRKKNTFLKKEEVPSDPEEENRNAELELLLADDNPEESDKHHFNLKAIQKNEKDSNKKKKWKKTLKKKSYQEEDNFKIDTTDSRFSALFTSHHFNIDPADPHFRKTKAMNELIAEKQKRRKLDS